jgi:hypothetical protein
MIAQPSTTDHIGGRTPDQLETFPFVRDGGFQPPFCVRCSYKPQPRRTSVAELTKSVF